MTGKTHMAISAATVALALAAAGAEASMEMPRLLPLVPLVPIEPGASKPGACAVAGLLVLGIAAGLFPDLDAPDTVLQHLPARAARQVGRYIKAGMPRRSLLSTLAQELVRLAALPFSMALVGASVMLRTFTGHRGFTHTMWGALTFTGLAATIALLVTGSAHWSLTVGAVWLLGYASHLAADACTLSGIPLFGCSGNSGKSGNSRSTGNSSDAPTVRLRFTSQSGLVQGPAWSSPASAFHLLPKRMRVRTGAPADTLFVRWVSWAVFIAAAAPMFMG